MTSRSAVRHAHFRREALMVGYSAGNLGKNLLLGSVDVTLVFILTDLLGIPSATVGPVMLIIFVGDLIFDVAAGYLATWSRRRGVGYRTMMSIAALPCGLGFAAFYALPALRLRDLALLAPILLLFRAAYAIIDVPHNSLLARVAPDSRARGRVSGYRLLFSSLASLATATLFTPAVLAADGPAGSRPLAMLGLLGAAVSCLALWTSASSSRLDRLDHGEARSPQAITLFPKPDRLLAGIIAIAALLGLATPMLGRMSFYLATYVYGRPALAGQLLLAITIGQFPGALLWTALVRIADKTTLLFASHAIVATAVLVLALLGSDPRWLLAVAVVVGMGFAGVFMFPWGILADIVDIAEYRHRERREAATVAAVLVTIKASAAAGAGLIGFVLAGVGYHVGAPTTPTVIAGMKAVAFGAPIAGSLLSMLILTRVRVTGRDHSAVLRILAGRRRRTAFRASHQDPDPARAPVSMS